MAGSSLKSPRLLSDRWGPPQGHSVDQPVVVDENVITSRFIYDIPQFVDAIVAQLN